MKKVIWILVLVIAVVGVLVYRNNNKVVSPISLTGTWTAVDDSAYKITFSDNGSFSESYDGTENNVGSWIIDTNGEYPTIKLTDKDITRDWSTVSFTQNSLEVLVTTGRGNILRFRR